MGVFSESGGQPNAKKAQTGTITSPGNGTYTYQSLTEFSLDVANNWLAVVADNGTFALNGKGSAISSTTKDRSFTFNTTLPDPYSPTNADVNVPRLKISHS